MYRRAESSEAVETVDINVSCVRLTTDQQAATTTDNYYSHNNYNER